MTNGDGALGPVNLGNPVETTVGEMARIIIDIVGSRQRSSLSRCQSMIRDGGGRI